MKKIGITIFAALSMMAAVSCTDKLESSINGLRTRIYDLESLVNSINEYYSNTSKIVAALEDNDMIKSITPVKGDDGDSYLITFVSGQTLTLIQGIDGTSPNLGIRKYDDGIYYWTIQYGSEEPQWLLSSLGMKIRASALTPQMKIEDGWWQYTYDGGGSWIRLCEASGEAGKSVFKSVSISDYFVTFTLNGAGMFQIPTVTYFNRVTERCDNLSREMSLAGTTLAGVDTMKAVKSITQIMDGDKLVGYTLLLNDGSEFQIRPGKDEQPFDFTIRRSYDDWMDYWAVKVGDGDYEWVIKPNGDKAQASSISGTPRLSVRDTLDGYYFVYSFYPDINDYQVLRDSKGNPVAANSFENLALFKSVAVGTESVALTLADDKTIYLPFYYAKTPSISFTVPSDLDFNTSTNRYSLVVSGVSYTVGYNITDAPEGLQIEAIALDGAYVKSISKNVSGSTVSGDIVFATPTEFPQGVVSTRILVFLTWGSNVTMKVLEFDNGD